MSLSSLADLLHHQGKHEEAEPLFRRALKICEKVLSPEHPHTVTSLSSLAELLHHQGKHEEAELLFRRALEIHEKVLGPEHPDTATSLNYLAGLLESQGKYEEAEPLYRRALEIREKVLGPDHPATADSLSRVAHLEADMGHAEVAWQLFHRGLEGSLGHLQVLFRGATEADRFRYVEQKSTYLEFLLSLTTDREAGLNDARHLDAAYEGLLLWKGQVFRSTAWLRAKTFAVLSEEQRKKIDELRAVQGRLSQLSSPRELRDPGRQRVRPEELAKRREELEGELVRELAEDWAEKPVEVRELTAMLPARSVLIDFHVHSRPSRGMGSHWDPPRLSAWVLRPGAVHVRHLDLGLASEMAEAVEQYLENLVHYRGIRPQKEKQPGPTPTDQLRKLLWDPLRESVADAELIFVSPDVFLATLPFETLQEKDGSFLIEKHSFVYLQDARSLARMEQPEKPVRKDPPSLLLTGAVDYDLRGKAPKGALLAKAEFRGPVKGTWVPLSLTRQEVDGIERLHRLTFGKEAPRQVLRDQAATEDKLKLSLPDFRVVHLATHGFFQPMGWTSLQEAARKAVRESGPETVLGRDRPPALVGHLPGLLSGLVCAGANLSVEEKRDDGLLTAEEVAWLNLEGCELVVLSACQTGLGRAKSGEGLMSLRRSFRLAGAKTVISSLWRVRDDSTKTLMLDFYERLWKQGEGKLEALRHAQLAMLKRNRERYGLARPSTWGAFVLSGEWR